MHLLRFGLCRTGGNGAERLRLAVGDSGKGTAQLVCQSRLFRRTNEIDLDAGGAEQLLICRISGCRCQGSNFFRCAAGGKCGRFAVECCTACLIQGVGTLFIDLRLDGVQQVLLPDAEFVLGECAVCGVGAKQAVQQQFQHLVKERFLFQRITVVNDGGGDVVGLDVALPLDAAEDGCAVEHLELFPELCNGGVTLVARCQEGGGEGASGSSGSRERLAEKDFQRIGLEFRIQNLGVADALGEQDPFVIGRHRIFPFSFPA